MNASDQKRDESKGIGRNVLESQRKKWRGKLNFIPRRISYNVIL